MTTAQIVHSRRAMMCTMTSSLTIEHFSTPSLSLQEWKVKASRAISRAFADCGLWPLDEGAKNFTLGSQHLSVKLRGSTQLIATSQQNEELSTPCHAATFSDYAGASSSAADPQFLHPRQGKELVHSPASKAGSTRTEHPHSVCSSQVLSMQSNRSHTTAPRRSEEAATHKKIALTPGLHEGSLEILAQQLAFMHLRGYDSDAGGWRMLERRQGK